MKENKTYQVCHERKCHHCAVDKNDIDKLTASAVNLHSVLERLTTSKVTVFGGRQRHLTPFSLICYMVILKLLSENTHEHIRSFEGLGFCYRSHFKGIFCHKETCLYLQRSIILQHLLAYGNTCWKFGLHRLLCFGFFVDLVSLSRYA